MFIFEDRLGLTTNNENLTLQMEYDHPGILVAFNQYVYKNSNTLLSDTWTRENSSFKVDGFEFNNEKYFVNGCYYDSYYEGRHLWNYYEDDDRLWYVYDPESMLPGSIMANVPMQVEAESMGSIYGYRAVWTGKSWVFDDFDPATAVPSVRRFRIW